MAIARGVLMYVPLFSSILYAHTVPKSCCNTDATIFFLFFKRYLSQGNLRDANILMDEIKQQLELGELELPQSELMQFIEYLLLT